MTYFLRAVDYRHYAIEQAGKVLADLNYKSWTHSRAEVIFPNSHYTFEKDDFWGSRIKIIKNGMLIGLIKSNWKGQVLIELKGGFNFPVTFLMRHRGFFNTRFEVYSEEIPILNLHAKHAWIRAHYEIELLNVKDLPLPLEELLGILAFSGRFHNAMNSG